MKKITKKQQHAIHALAYMQELFAAYPLTELVYTTPFQLLVAVIMSAQTTDKQVNKVNEQFFRVVERPEDIVALGESGVGEIIKTVGLWKSKTTNLVKMAHQLTINDGQLPINGNSKIVFDAVAADTIRPYAKKVNNDINIREQQRQYADAQALYNDRWYRIPDTIDEITKLPGVGIKTAKVVLYILYGQRRVAVDTHVHRVMNRLGIVATNTP